MNKEKIKKEFSLKIINKKIGKIVKENRIRLENNRENLYIKRWWIWFLSPKNGFFKFKDLVIVNLNKSTPGNNSKKKISSE